MPHHAHPPLIDSGQGRTGAEVSGSAALLAGSMGMGAMLGVLLALLWLGSWLPPLALLAGGLVGYRLGRFAQIGEANRDAEDARDGEGGNKNSPIF